MCERSVLAGITVDMSLPTTPVDRDRPKGPNFLAIVIGFAVAILVILLAAWFFMGRAGKSAFPMKTRSTPSQTRLEMPQAAPLVVHA